MTVDGLIGAGSASKEAIRRRMADIESLIARLDAEWAELDAVRADDLPADEAGAITRFAAHVR
ncbi:MAG TPA: hypothetical protein VH482_27290 [Thermomicrobiales bacterium]|jgi:hypothetical protein